MQRAVSGPGWLFGTLFGVILIAVTLVGIEVLSLFYVPTWPAQAMNPREPAPVRPLATPFKNQPWPADPDNSWDSERTIDKPPGAWRAILVATASSTRASRRCRCRRRCRSARSPARRSKR